MPLSSSSQVTFSKRKVGLLKKAAELGIPCGIKVSLVFSDMNNSLHTYCNNKDIKFLVSPSYSAALKNPCWAEYTEASVRLLTLILVPFRRDPQRAAPKNHREVTHNPQHAL